jgi:hypothetical protein
LTGFNVDHCKSCRSVCIKISATNARFFVHVGLKRKSSTNVTVLFVLVSKINKIEVKMKFGSEAWVLKKKEEQHLEATEMKFLRHLLE